MDDELKGKIKINMVLRRDDILLDKCYFVIDLIFLIKSNFDLVPSVTHTNIISTLLLPTDILGAGSSRIPLTRLFLRKLVCFLVTFLF